LSLFFTVVWNYRCCCFHSLSIPTVRKDPPLGLLLVRCSPSVVVSPPCGLLVSRAWRLNNIGRCYTDKLCGVNNVRVFGMTQRSFCYPPKLHKIGLVGKNRANALNPDSSTRPHVHNVFPRHPPACRNFLSCTFPPLSLFSACTRPRVLSIYTCLTSYSGYFLCICA
jgi:hypothetical protein